VPLPVPCPEGTAPHMAGHIQDRWFKAETDSNGKTTKTNRHGTGMRYRARYVGPDGTEKSKSFPDRQKRLAEQWLAHIEADMSRGQYVDPKASRTTFQQYAERWVHDSNQQTRFWAVEGLAMLGIDESIDPLLSILAHDSSRKIRERAACNLARSGMLTGEQRLTAVPQLLNLLDDDSLDSGTQDLVYAVLHSITGASFGKDPEAWRDWWAHHDRREKPHHIPRGLSFV